MNGPFLLVVSTGLPEPADPDESTMPAEFNAETAIAAPVSAEADAVDDATV